MAKKRTQHIIHDDEVELGTLQLQQMFGPTWKDDIELAISTIFCDCRSDNRKLIDYKSYMNDINDIIFLGKCSSCKTIAARYIETGERKGIKKIADKIRKLNKS